MVEGQRGHWPLLSPADGTTPWYWGETQDEAQAKADVANLEDFGLTPEESRAIIDRSFGRT